MSGVSAYTIAKLALLKGAVMAVILSTVAELAFLQGLITAIASATVSGIFLLVATHMNTKRTVEVQERVERKIDQAAEVVAEEHET